MVTASHDAGLHRCGTVGPPRDLVGVDPGVPEGADKGFACRVVPDASEGDDGRAERGGVERCVAGAAGAEILALVAEHERRRLAGHTRAGTVQKTVRHEITPDQDTPPGEALDSGAQLARRSGAAGLGHRNRP